MMVIIYLEHELLLKVTCDPLQVNVEVSKVKMGQVSRSTLFKGQIMTYLNILPCEILVVRKNCRLTIDGELIDKVSQLQFTN